VNARRLALFAASLGAFCALVIAAACSTAPPPSQADDCPMVSTACPSPPPSWSKDVQPLIQTYCVTCHSPGPQGIGEMFADLTSYAGAFKARAEITSQVYHCWMPNQDASSPPPPLLTSAQRETIVAWVACNAPNN
jgi:cytochrome c551/c552